MSRISFSITLIAFLLFSATLQAQTTSTRLDGTVLDASGNAIQGATVSATDESTGWSTEVSTNAQGYYVFPALKAGVYTVSAKANNFKGLIRRQVSLLQPNNVTENFALQPGSPTETDEEFEANRPLPQTDAQISGSFSRRDLEGLPLVNRDPLALLVYQPGVLIAGGNEGVSSVNATRQGSNVLTMDGVSVADPVNPRLGTSLTATNVDAIQEVRIVTDGAKAEYGQSSGAHVTLITRSGTNAWHGSAFDYFRPNAMNARDFFSNSLSWIDLNNAPMNPAKPTFQQNIYGGMISGPAWKDRTFLFADYQGRITDQRQIVNSLVLTPIAKTGIFQWYTPGTTNLQAFDVLAADPRKLGMDPKIKSILATMPDPNNHSIGDTLNTAGYQFNSDAGSNDNQVTGRLDHALTSANHLFARFSYDRSNTTDAPALYPGGLAGTAIAQNYGVAAGSDWTVNPRMVNELRFGYLNATLNVNRPDRTTTPMVIPNSWTYTTNPAFPRSANYPITEASDSFTLARGNHTFKLGAMFRRTVLNSTDFSGVYPDLTTGLSNGNQPPASIGPSLTSAISASDRQRFEYLYNDLLGRVEQVTQTFNAGAQTFLPTGSPQVRSYSYQNYGAFLQDDWKVRPNFTLSLGFRYELSSVPHESGGLQAALDQATQVNSSAHISNFAFLPGGAWYNRDTRNFAPRAGFAWDISKKGKMVLRGSYGIFYDNLAGDVVNFVNQNTPLFSELTTLYPNASGKDVRVSNGLVLPTAPAATIVKPPLTRADSVAMFDPNLRTGRVQQFNLTLQRDIFWHTVLEASYSGSRADNLLMYLDLNQTKIEGDFLQSFTQLQAFRTHGTPVPASNTLVRLFGSPGAAINAIGGRNLDLGLVGTAADIVDRTYYANYAPAGVSNFYIRNFPQFNQLVYGGNSGKSWYDSVRFGAHRTADSYSVAAYYTWGKSLDTISMAGNSFVAPSDSFNPASNKAPSDFDRQRVVNAFGTWRLPLAENGIFSRWNMGMMTIWERGQRFSVSSGRQMAQTGVDSLADYSGSRNIGNVVRESSGVYWFTVDQNSLFTIPAAGTRGTSGRNSFIGPGFFSLDASLFKAFRVREGKSIMFRAECLNVLNHTNFGVPATNLSDPANFGRITTQVGSPRALQFSLRFMF